MTVARGGWVDAGGTRWRPLRDGEPRRLGDRWFRLSDDGGCGWCRSMRATLLDAFADAFADADKGPRAQRAWGCNAVPLRPETQKEPPEGYPRPVFLHDLRPDPQGGFAGLFPRPADLAARGAPGGPVHHPRRATGEMVAAAVQRGRALRARRDALGLTQRAVAERAGLDRSSVDALERGRRIESVGPLRRLGEALDAIERERAPGVAS